MCVKNISILGCGWLGFSLATNLLKNNILVKGSTTNLKKLKLLKENSIDPYQIDIADDSIDLSSFLKTEILIISITSKNIKNYKHLIQKIEAANIKKVIFISSTSVYISENKTVTEKSPTNNLPLKQLENLFIANTNFKTTIIRFAGLYGYDRQPCFFHKSGAIIKNPEGFVNLIHRDDCIKIILAIIQKNIFGNVFNACSDFHPKRRDFYMQEKIKNGLPKPIFDEQSSLSYKIINSDKLKKQINLNTI
ncbi:MAG: NAD(P)H-binding protein [Vicingaceae bacterium]